MGIPETFRIDPFGRYGLWVSTLFVPAVWLAWPHYALLLGLALSILVFVTILLTVGTVTVDDHGIVLFRVNKATWQEITAVKRTSFLGLPYLYIFRAKGFRWRLPLYIRRIDAFKAALLSKAPTGHPLRSYAEGNI